MILWYHSTPFQVGFLLLFTSLLSLRGSFGCKNLKLKFDVRKIMERKYEAVFTQSLPNPPATLLMLYHKLLVRHQLPIQENMIGGHLDFKSKQSQYDWNPTPSPIVNQKLELK